MRRVGGRGESRRVGAMFLIRGVQASSAELGGWMEMEGECNMSDKRFVELCMFKYILYNRGSSKWKEERTKSKEYG